MKVVQCRDVGFVCDAVVRAPTEEEALSQVAEHARTVHGLEEVSDDVVRKVQAVTRDEES